MITSKDSYVSLGCVALLAFSASVAHALSYRLSSPKVQAGEHAILEVRLPVPPEQVNSEELEPPQVNDDLLTQAQGFQVLERDFRRDGNEWVWRYEITAYQPGKVTIPPIEIRSPGANFSTESVPLEIVTSRGEEDGNLRPEFGPIRRPFPWGSLVKWAFLLALLNAAVYFAKKHAHRLKLKRRPKPAPVAPPPTREDDLLWLRRQFARLKLELESVKDKGRIIDETTHVLREFYARRTNLPVEAWTTSEFRTKFGKDETAAKISPLFEVCDRYKFSGGAGDAFAIAKGTLEESERTLLAC